MRAIPRLPSPLPANCGRWVTKQQALLVLQQAAALHPSHRGILSEMGRLALDLEQVEVAQKLPAEADDAASADWRIISARGTVLAKQGRDREAILLYERALALAPKETSILNNLALALTMEGHAEQAESLLKQALAQGNHATRVSQNFALVLSLQGKYEEAKLVAARQLSAEAAGANVEFVRRMVQTRGQAVPGDGEGRPSCGERGCLGARAGAGRGGARRVGCRLDHACSPGQGRSLSRDRRVGHSLEAGGLAQRRQGEA
jgi:tetratricopeptide (TPR) repeat protein